MTKFSEKLNTYIAVVTGIAAVVGLGFVYAQMEQANELRRWTNYNEMNLRYHQLYSAIPDTLTGGKTIEFEEFSLKEKRWVRQYFNLYAEEYYLFLENLIPKQMWTERIANGVAVNLAQYPLLIEGYEYWKRQGALSHPKDFREMVDAKIKSVIKKHPEIRKKLGRP